MRCGRHSFASTASELGLTELTVGALIGPILAADHQRFFGM
jgi:hypothetical protein